MSEQAEDPEGKEAPKKEKQEYYTDMPVGEILRRAREHCERSLDEVQADLRIRKIQIEAIETGRQEDLPGRVYAIGFVRSYAEYLGLDGDQMVQLYKSQSLGSRSRPKLNFPVPASESRVPPFWLVIVGLVLATLFVAFWSSFQADNKFSIKNIPSAMMPKSAPEPASVAVQKAPEPAQEAPPPEQTAEDVLDAEPVPDTQIQIYQDPQTGENAVVQTPVTPNEEPSSEIPDPYAAPPVPAEIAQETAENVKAQIEGEFAEQQAQGTPSSEGAQAQAENAPEETEEPKQDEKQRGITLNVLESSWVEIRDQNGRAIVSRVLDVGDQYFVPDRPDLTMSLGNAGGVQIIIDDQTLPLLGKRGHVRRNISLDVETLKNLAGTAE